MITTAFIENSIVDLLSSRYPNADIFRRNATQTRENKPTFVVTVDLQSQTENKNYQRKDVEITVQYFEDDRISFNRNLNDIRDILVSDIFINSIPIIDLTKKVVKYLLVKDTTVAVTDDILSLRIVSDYVDDNLRNSDIHYDPMGSLHLKKEC